MSTLFSSSKSYSATSSSVRFVDVGDLATNALRPRLSCVRNSLISLRQLSASSDTTEFAVSHTHFFPYRVLSRRSFLLVGSAFSDKVAPNVRLRLHFLTEYLPEAAGMCHSPAEVYRLRFTCSRSIPRFSTWILLARAKIFLHVVSLQPYKQSLRSTALRPACLCVRQLLPIRCFREQRTGGCGIGLYTSPSIARKAQAPVRQPISTSRSIAANRIRPE